MRAVFASLFLVTLVGCSGDDRSFGEGQSDSSSDTLNDDTSLETSTDGSMPDTSDDTTTDDTGTADTGSDSGADTTVVDSGHDSSAPDTFVPDTFVPDTYVPDTFKPDTYVPDTFVADTAKDTSTPPECATAADCRLYSDYCSDPGQLCTCVPLAKTAPNPACSGGTGSCFINPCNGKSVDCVGGKCVLGGAL